MKLISTTLTGNSQDTIGDALRSVVDHVDACVVIDTGITDDTLRVAREVCLEKQVKLVISNFPWCNDFAAARNWSALAAFDAARTFGVAGEDCWQVFVDSDEQLQNMEGVRAVLESSDKDYYLVTHFSETHERERIFRLPIKGSWSGPTHEAYCNGGAADKMPLLRTFERPKDEAQLAHKFQRDEEILRAHTAAHPADARWWYYLGDALQNQRKFQEATEAYHKCVMCGGWREEGAWACFKAAVCHAEMEEWEQSVRACSRGLSIHAGFAELAWLAGWARSKQGDQMQAYAWAKMAAAMGAHAGKQDMLGRIGFKHLPGLWEGPYDLLRFCAPSVEERAIAQQIWEHAQTRGA